MEVIYILDYFINLYNKYFKNKISYIYNDWYDCHIYNFDFEDGVLNV